MTASVGEDMQPLSIAASSLVSSLASAVESGAAQVPALELASVHFCRILILPLTRFSEVLGDRLKAFELAAQHGAPRHAQHEHEHSGNDDRQSSLADRQGASLSANGALVGGALTGSNGPASRITA
jgi:hypothetical protein